MRTMIERVPVRFALAVAVMTLSMPPAVRAQKPLGVEEHSAGGVNVELVEVTRSAGDTVTVRWRYVNTTAQSKVLAREDGPYALCKDAYLIDPVNKKKHLILRDSDNNPIGTRVERGSMDRLQTIAVGPRQTLVTWARFPAPPAAVAKISVHLSGIPPFEDVAIGR